MADTYSRRPFGRNYQPSRNDQTAAGVHGDQADRDHRDPLAELARLIGEKDPFGEYGSAVDEFRRASAPQGRPNPEYSGQLRGRNAESAGGGFENHPNDPSGGASNFEDLDFDQDEETPRRRLGILVIAGIFGLAVLGTAGAFGYRSFFGSAEVSRQPPVIKADSHAVKVVPPNANKNSRSNKQIADRADDRGEERIVSRAEQPIAPKNNISQPVENNGFGPKKIRTIAIRPDGSVASTATDQSMPRDDMINNALPATESGSTDQHESETPKALPQRSEIGVPHQVVSAAVPRHGVPLSLSPTRASTDTAVTPARVASAGPTQLAPTNVAAGGYGVQVTSQHSDNDARASLRALQAKYPAQLKGKRFFIHRVNLGAKGVYYRALIGPFADLGAANDLCSNLKAAGGHCVVQRN